MCAAQSARSFGSSPSCNCTPRGILSLCRRRGVAARNQFFLPLGVFAAPCPVDAFFCIRSLHSRGMVHRVNFKFETNLKRLAQGAMMRLLFGDGNLNFGVVSPHTAYVWFE